METGASAWLSLLETEMDELHSWRVDTLDDDGDDGDDGDDACCSSSFHIQPRLPSKFEAGPHHIPFHTPTISTHIHLWTIRSSASVWSRKSLMAAASPMHVNPFPSPLTAACLLLVGAGPPDLCAPPDSRGCTVWDAARHGVPGGPSRSHHSRQVSS